MHSVFFQCIKVDVSFLPYMVAFLVLVLGGWCILHYHNKELITPPYVFYSYWDAEGTL